MDTQITAAAIVVLQFCGAPSHLPLPLPHAPPYVQAVAVVQRSMRGEDPAGMMADLGFGPLLLIANFPVKMSGAVLHVLVI